MKAIVLSSAPVLLNDSMKNLASSNGTPIAAKTTANFSSLPFTAACLTICAAILLCGNPEPLKIGSFCPLTMEFNPSIAEIPVSMNSDGGILEAGFIGAPWMSR